MRKVLLSAVITAALISCKENQEKAISLKTYGGPLMSTQDVATTYSDSSITKLKLFAPLQLEFSDGDRQFPKGIEVHFYNSSGKHTSTLTANYARYDRQTEIYIARGNVVIENFEEKRKLNTEELRWNRVLSKVYSNQFVRIETAAETLTGEGLEAAQDFSWYKILKPTGVFSKDVL